MFILATLAVIVVIGALFIGNIRQNTRDAIVLPDTAQSVQSESQPDENKPALLEVTRENVQNIVRSLHRPQYYHQTYTITRQMNGAVSETSAELWVADTRVCAVLTTASGEKHILTDGETLYVWYAGDETVRTLAASQNATMDELIGIPTYEQVGAMPPAAITDGEFITDDRYDSGQQIFAAAEEGTVETIVFRGNHLDVSIRIKGLLVHGEYSMDAAPLAVGEMVQVLIYRLYIFDKERTYLTENSAMKADNVFYI